MSEYRTLFDARGGRYNRANALFPQARAEEARHLLLHLDLAAGGPWLDVGAGGGFLADQAAASGCGAGAVGCDESFGFISGSRSYVFRTVAGYDALPFSDRTFSATGCLAVLHHAPDPGSWIAEMVRVTAPGGRVAVGDVAAGSRASRFLNTFVDANTETGHHGRFSESWVLADALVRAGGGDPRITEGRTHWNFGSRGEAHQFFRELFGLRSETREAELDDALAGLGLAGRDSLWSLPWRMSFVSAAVTG